jgi:lipoprotein NlpI
MDAFQNGQVEESVRIFDSAASLAPSLSPFLWQRGISLYYVDRFEDASKQFRVDVQVNPNDTEEIVWDIASQLRYLPLEQVKMMQLPPGVNDRRRIMVRTTFEPTTIISRILIYF